MKSFFAAGYEKEMNVTIAFRAKIPTGRFTLRIAASNTFRVFVDGEFLCYGPLRTAHDYSNISEYVYDSDKHSCYVVAEVASYNINTFYTVCEAPFFACEVLSDGNIVADTSAFAGYLLSDRVKKVQKYSMQRPFAESYIMDADRQGFYMGGGNFPEAPLCEVPGNWLLKCELKNPKFDFIRVDKAIESGKVARDNKAFVHHSDWYCDWLEEKFRAYKNSELEHDLLTDACQLKYIPGITANDFTNRYDLYELSRNTTGFVELDVIAHTDSEIYFLFDEILYDEIKQNTELGKYFQGSERQLVFWRGNTINAVKWKLKTGKYKLQTFEPYTMKYLKVVVLGDASVTPNIITYENPAIAMKLNANDEILQNILDAAAATFRQNAVDVLTDCPSRERAGWLCDSYFTARAEKLFTGGNLVEKNMLTAYLLSPQSEYLPEGMLPMCYPADHCNGNYIANWALWLIIELEDYQKRTGDTALIAAFKDKIYRLLKCIANFENTDGLLERVDRWVFIEWSRANEFTMDVNYPSNMLYYGALSAAAQLYDNKALTKKAANIKTAIVLQSYNGEFFIDNAVREGETLKPTNNTTETCQYYAFWFNIVDRESHPALYNTMFNVIKPNRGSDIYPNLYKSNAFIGNFLRLDYLAREGKHRQVLDECVDYFAYMANRTGTLWEHDAPNASCNHGFASYAAAFILNATNSRK